MAIKRENKRAQVTLTPSQQHALTQLSKKYHLSESSILARSFDLLLAQEQAHFDVGLANKQRKLKT